MGGNGTGNGGPKVIDPKTLPVYQQRDRILEALKEHQVVVVESPTGSGKTTQLPVILHEAGYSRDGVIGVTQPRRIAAVSVSAFIARQLSVPIKGLVGYKMRFDDQTTLETRLKVMTDGILLQEIKANETLNGYSVIMVDEAHERSLNIDFVLGLLKRALRQREDLRVIVSSATINAAIFSEYFDSAPIVRIETPMHPVQVIYDDPATGSAAVDAQLVERTTGRPPRQRDVDTERLLERIVRVISRVRDEEYEGDILIFLPGEQIIKDCITRLYAQPYRSELDIIPLYGRLSKEEQDAVFPPSPEGKRKVVVATNIAETSITIDGITVVIDSGLAKTNFYNPRTYTSALVEGPISRASANQRRGRAGRTRPGRCYRLYSRKDFDQRPLFQEDEIYRTDLSEVVLRMAELGIRDFEQFDFISSPGTGNIRGAIETLRLLDALQDNRKLTEAGRMMAIFPLLPRHSRIIIEAIHRYPQVLQEVLIAVSFLTSQTPFILPPGEEMEARQAHHRYRDELGDFVSYLRLFEAYKQAEQKEQFCEKRYLDPRTMAEIANIQEQLAEIVSSLGVPISSGGGKDAYLSSIARGLIQFVCVRTGRGVYQSLTAERIMIHPGSGMFREDPRFIVAGEVVHTSRTYARSVSPLKKEWLAGISPELYRGLQSAADTDNRRGKREAPETTKKRSAPRDTTWQVQVGGFALPVQPFKGKKKIVVLDYATLIKLGKQRPSIPSHATALRSKVELGEYTVMNGDRLGQVLRAAPYLDPQGVVVTSVPSARLSANDESNRETIAGHMDILLRLAPAKRNGTQLGFITLYSSREGIYWFKPNRSFINAVHESLASLEQLIDDLDGHASGETLPALSAAWRKLSAIIEG